MQWSDAFNKSSYKSIELNEYAKPENEAKILGFNFLDKKDKFIENETPISAGFYSIWLIPKIS